MELYQRVQSKLDQVDEVAIVEIYSKVPTRRANPLRAEQDSTANAASGARALNTSCYSNAAVLPNTRAALGVGAAQRTALAITRCTLALW
jgi:hypothetical protein